MQKLRRKHLAFTQSNSDGEAGAASFGGRRYPNVMWFQLWFVFYTDFLNKNTFLYATVKAYIGSTGNF
jgi:hypothetical protein